MLLGLSLYKFVGYFSSGMGEGLPLPLVVFFALYLGSFGAQVLNIYYYYYYYYYYLKNLVPDFFFENFKK
jgi:hypothetical protein